MRVLVNERYTLGEDIFISFSHMAGNLRIVIYDLRNQRYLHRNASGNWIFSNTYQYTDINSNDFTSVQTALGPVNVYNIRIPRTALAKNTRYLVQGVDISNGDNDTKYFLYGEILQEPSLITVYGILRDATGNPLINLTITFSVVNPVSYFDNSLTSKITATATTNENGLFSINLNRQYNYIMTVPGLDFMKLIKISEVPNTVTAVEIIPEAIENIC